MFNKLLYKLLQLYFSILNTTNSLLLQKKHPGAVLFAVRSDPPVPGHQRRLLGGRGLVRAERQGGGQPDWLNFLRLPDEVLQRLQAALHYWCAFDFHQYVSHTNCFVNIKFIYIYVKLY